MNIDSRYVKLTDYENYILNKFPQNLLVQLVIGNAKNTRLIDCLCVDSKKMFGASFAAPMLYSYVNWLLELSVKQGIKRLYFIARDGYILHKIADIIIHNKNLDITTKYKVQALFTYEFKQLLLKI